MGTRILPVLALLLAATASAHDGEIPSDTPSQPPRTPAPLPVSPGTGSERPPAVTEGPGLAGSITSDEDWRVWWYLNRDLWIDRTARFAPPAIPPAAVEDPKQSVPGPPRELLRDAALVALRAAARSKDKDLASTAILALAKAGDSASWELFREAARNRDRPRDVRQSAILAIGLTGDAADSSRELLAGLLADSRLETPDRGLAAISLGLLGHPGAIPPLAAARLLKGSQAEVSVMSMIGLGLLRDDLVLPDLARWLSGHQGARESKDLVRAGVAAGLGKLRSRDGVPALMSSLADREKHVRRQALLSLGGLVGADDEAAVRALLLLLRSDRDNLSVCYAGLTLGESGSPLAADALRAVYEGTDQSPVPWAAVALGLLAGRLSDGPRAERLRAFLVSELKNDAKTERTLALCAAAGLARAPAAVPVLRELFASSSSAEKQAYAALALGMLGDQASIPGLREQLGEKAHPYLLWDSALALGILGDREAPRLLEKRLRSAQSQSARAGVAIAMGFCARLEEADVLVRVVSDDRLPDTVRAAAATGLGMILDDGPIPVLTRLRSRLSPVLPVETLCLAFRFL